MTQHRGATREARLGSDRVLLEHMGGRNTMEARSMKSWKIKIRRKRPQRSWIYAIQRETGERTDTDIAKHLENEHYSRRAKMIKLLNEIMFI